MSPGRVAVSVCALMAAGSCSSQPSSCDPTSDPAVALQGAGYALQFCGTGRDDLDRVKISVDDPRTDGPGPAVDVGAQDFTIEWWMRANPSDNRQPPVVCGANLDWIDGNILIDRDRYNQGRKYGVSIAGGRIVFGVSGRDDDHRTICGTSIVADGRWHHVAVQRRRVDGYMSLYVDGALDAEADGPDGDVSYPDDGVPLEFCGGPCSNSDPYLVMGAEKHDAGPAWPAYTGWLDEVRVSNAVRYAVGFARPTSPFEPDSVTAALWHFDDGRGDVLTDDGPSGSHGDVRVGGRYDAPRWVVSSAPLR